MDVSERFTYIGFGLNTGENGWRGSPPWIRMHLALASWGVGNLP